MCFVFLCDEEERELGRQQASGSCPYCGGKVQAMDFESRRRGNGMLGYCLFENLEGYPLIITPVGLSSFFSVEGERLFPPHFFAEKAVIFVKVNLFSPL
uniref:Uncharacterized protein n=1 Tax=Salix viminalis TaxID=40686 RepID=A0A6N2KT90_SALVM